MEDDVLFFVAFLAQDYFVIQFDMSVCTMAYGDECKIITDHRSIRSYGGCALNENQFPNMMLIP